MHRRRHPAFHLPAVFALSLLAHMAIVAVDPTASACLRARYLLQSIPQAVRLRITKRAVIELARRAVALAVDVEGRAWFLVSEATVECAHDGFTGWRDVEVDALAQCIDGDEAVFRGCGEVVGIVLY